jgi:hypothetical protein
VLSTDHTRSGIRETTAVRATKIDETFQNPFVDGGARSKAMRRRAAL